MLDGVDPSLGGSPALGVLLLIGHAVRGLFSFVPLVVAIVERVNAHSFCLGVFPAGFRVYVAWSARQTLCVQVGAGFHGINHFVFYSMTRTDLPMVTGRPCPRLIDSVPAGKNKVTTDTQHLEESSWIGTWRY